MLSGTLFLLVFHEQKPLNQTVPDATHIADVPPEIMPGLTDQFIRIDMPATNRAPAFSYYLLQPEGYDPARSYPLVVLLHGSSRHMYGGLYYVNSGVNKIHPAFLFVPVAPAGMDWGNPESDQTSVGPLVIQILDELRQKYNIDNSRIYISGYSLGGIGTFAMIRDHPDLFAAGLVLCGAWDPVQAVQFSTDVPIMALRGEKDNLLDARPMIIALQKADRPAIYREYPGINHNVWDYAYPDPAIWDWLFSQQRKR